ncbi:MAG: hypothetical protein ACE5E3_03290, partial [Mariprofundus sp.]
MTAGLRRSLIGGAVLLALFILLWLRLDTDALYANIEQKMESSVADSTLQAEHVSLTLLRGLGLRIAKVKLQHPHYQAQIGHIDVGIRLLPLLLGKIEIDSLDMHDAEFTLPANTTALTSASISSLPVDRIQLIRSRILAKDGTELLNNLFLELRGIGPNRETLWEFNAQQEKQSVSGHGRMLFHTGEMASGFGKFNLEKLPVARLRSIAPASLLKWLDGTQRTLSGSLTLDITKHQSWALFGEIMVKNSHAETALKLRGKLSHPADGHLIWRDSFIHFDDQSVVAIAGACEQDQCNTTLDAKNIPLAKWSAFIPESVRFHRNISGITNLIASISWQQQAWQGEASLLIKNASFQYADEKIKLPDLHLKSSEMSGDMKQWQANATITSPEADGELLVHSEQKKSGEQNMRIETVDISSELWLPLANLLLASMDQPPHLQAKGNISGKLHLQQRKQQKHLELDIDAKQARLSYNSWFEKPAHMNAACKINIIQAEKSWQSLALEKCSLDFSSIARLDWSKKNASQQLNINKLNVNFDQLKSRHVHLPEPLRHFKGLIEGGGKSKRASHTADWLSRLSGQWRLQNFGTDHWHANGNIKAERGIYSSKRLLIDGAIGTAELEGVFKASKKQGKINLISADIDWNSMSGLDDFWRNLSLSGRIQHTDLQLLDNHWQQIKSRYTLAKGILKLKKLQGQLADGSFTSKALSLSASEHGLNIQGSMRAKNVQLDQLQGLNDWLQAEISGKLHANIKLHGTLLHTAMADWQYSNGDILIYSGDWKQQL